ncbi:MAG: PIN domain-containing protein [Alphaproteobacteria bacterium]
MDRAVFDTNVIIQYSNGHEPSRDAFLRVTDRFISLTTWIEFLVGIAPPRRATYDRFLQENFEIVETNFDVAEFVIDIRRSKRLKLPDATIYATAKYVRAPLITFNTKDFDINEPDIYVPKAA